MSPDTGEIRKLAKDETVPEGMIGLARGKLFRLVEIETSLAVVVQVVSFGKGAIIVKPVDKKVLEPKAPPTEFPILGGDRRSTPKPHVVPWAWLAQFAQQVKSNHGDTLEVLADRGGLAWIELIAISRGVGRVGWAAIARELPTSADAQRVVLASIEKWKSKL